MPHLRITALLLACASLSACASNNMHAVTKATPAQTSALLDQVKSLNGEWEAADGKGTITFSTTSAGSVVREVMFPGTEHEMTNTYCMDGSALVLTHYCAMGNQPRMRATAGGKPGWINFECTNVTNWGGGDELYMGRMHLEIKDHDHIVEHWAHFQGNKVSEGPDIALTRKK